MFRFAFRTGLLVVAFVAFVASASAQSLTINYNFTGDPFYTAPRQAAITAAGDYIRTQVDARGSVTIQFASQDFGGINPLAFAGSNYLVQPGSFFNGILFRKGTTNSSPFGPPEAFATWNSFGGTTWYTGSGLPVTSGQIDMQSVALHEISHTLGFASLIDPSNGTGLQGIQPDTYSRFDDLLRLGNTTGAPRLINPNGTFNSAQVTTSDLIGNNIYFHGEMAMAANGGAPVRLAGGGDLSHLHSSVTNAVMLPAIGTGTARRTYQNVELAMLIDIGWNQFLWKNSTGNWADNISSLSNPRWTNLDGHDTLSPVGTITPNMVLRFGGSGGYTSTNGLDLSANADKFRVNRLILNATAGTSTIASNGSNILQFNTTIGITPLIRQDGAGAFNITHPIELTASNLQLGGNGGGNVALAGAITGNGGLTKIGTSTFELAGNTANTFTGTTTVNAGILLANKTAGQDAIASNATIAAGGTLRLGADNQLQGDGSGGKKITLSGGTLSTGSGVGFNDTVGALELTSSSTIALGSGSHTLMFSGISGTPVGTLTIIGWSGTENSTGTNGKLLFSNLGSTDFTSFLAVVQFQNFTTGGIFIATAQSGVVELVPVPEPTTILAIVAATLGAGSFVRRRLRFGKSMSIGSGEARGLGASAV